MNKLFIAALCGLLCAAFAHSLTLSNQNIVTSARVLGGSIISVATGAVGITWVAPSVGVVVSYEVRYKNVLDTVYSSLSVPAPAVTAELSGLSDGTYEVIIEAVFSDGLVSAPQTTFLKVN